MKSVTSKRLWLVAYCALYSVWFVVLVCWFHFLWGWQQEINQWHKELLNVTTN